MNFLSKSKKVKNVSLMTGVLSTTYKFLGVYPWGGLLALADNTFFILAGAL